MVDNNDRLSIFKMMYDEVKDIGKGLIYASNSTSDEVKIFNKNGAELLTGDKNFIQVKGKFLVVSKGDSIQLLNFSTGTSISIMISRYLFNMDRDIQELTENVTLVSEQNSILFIDNNCRVLDKIPGAEFKRINKRSTQGCSFSYKFAWPDLYLNDGYFSYLTNKVERYHTFELQDRYTLIATDIAKNKFSVNSKTKDKLRYKLGYNDSILSKNSYDDIVIPSQLKNTNTALTKEVVGYDIKTGLLELSTGKELLKPQFNDIIYYGADNYIATLDDGTSAVYNKYKGYTISPEHKAHVNIHNTLPCATININNSFYILDTLGRLCEYVYFTKMFKCSVCNKYKDIFRVELQHGNVYVTNRLAPIQDRNTIAMYDKEVWQLI